MTRRGWVLLAGPLTGTLVAILTASLGMNGGASLTAGITAWTALWWIGEPVPIPVTSMLPFVAFPACGILSDKIVARAYGHRMILLLLGGFILSQALEKCGAHKRLAMGMVRLVGGKSRRRIVLGFMIASALCSMWISNTATVLMMLPIILAVIEQDEDKQLAIPLLLGVAYASSIGGLGTPIGTPPNVIFIGQYEATTGKTWSFLEWMKLGVPVTAVFLPIMWLWLVRNLRDGDRLTIPEVGPWTAAERRVLTVFVITALLWMTRTAPFGGWATWLASLAGSATVTIGDSTVALAACIVLFVIPDGDDGQLLDWQTAKRIPWGLLLLFGGGIAIASAFAESGLSAALGEALSGLAKWPVILMVGLLCLSVTFLTEVTSNTATTTLLMPILAAAGIAAGVEPAALMVPAALSASCAFMLPVATAPNAIIFGTEYVTTRDMCRHGFVMNLVGIVIITTACTILL